jgi:multiple sugar transport system ATP-binding protein
VAEEATKMALVTLDRVTKTFGGAPVVDDLSLNIRDGEFLAIVGRSGCGKTTTLRMIAGLESASTGTIRIGDRVVDHVPPKDRDVAMVFQNYALFPHMSVYENLAFGMKVRHEPNAEIKRRIAEVSETLGIALLLDRRPNALSGGEQQRVSLGRAMLRRPQAFLMDEPLSNLDATLRVQMRAELSRLQKDLGVTTVYVTHDQVEAMTMGDRIAVMSEGRLQQLDTPEQIYDFPANVFVATFVGALRMNITDGRLTATDGETALSWLGQSVPAGRWATHNTNSDGVVRVGIRPEDLRPVLTGEPEGPHLTGVADIVEPTGAESFVLVRVGDATLTCRFPPRSGVQRGDSVRMQFSEARLHLFDSETGAALPN